MRAREARLAPPSLLRALRLLIPLALLGSALLGLLAQSASASHGPPPPPVIINGPGETGTADSLTWTFTLPGDPDGGFTPDPAATGTVTIDHQYAGECAVTAALPAPEAAYGPCSLSFTTPSPTDGAYAFSVRTVDVPVTHTTDAAGVTTSAAGTPVRSAAATALHLRDTTAPVVTVTPPASPAYTGWRVAVQDLTTATARCTITGPVGFVGYDQSCSDGSLVRPVLGPDGVYTLTATAADAAQRSGSASASFTYDGTDPVVAFTGQPASPSGVTAPQWTYSVSEGTVACTLTGPATPTSQTCGLTAYSASGLTTGSYVLTVVAVDAAGNQGQAVSSTYVLDATSPQVSITSSQPPRATSNTVSWRVTFDEGTGSCALSTGTAVTCTSGSTVSTTLTSDGTVTLTVVVTDGFGNRSERSVSYTRDTTVSFAVVAPLPSPSNDTRPTWTWSSTEATTITSCELLADGVPQSVTCNGTSYRPATQLPATPGTSYRLLLTVKDDLGNEGTFTSAAYLLDTQAAALVLVPAPGQGAVDDERSPSWTFGGDAWTSATCTFTIRGSTTSLGGTCSPTGFTAPLLEETSGTTYTLAVTVLDAAGNSASQTVSYVLDTTDPSVVVVPSAATGFDRTPSWTFTVVGATSASCVLRVGAVAVQSGSCSSLAGHTAAELPLTDGTTYLLTVTVLDAAGNSASQTVSYVLDTTDPSVVVVPSAATGFDRTPSWTFTVVGATSASCVLRVGAVAVQSGSCSSLAGHTAAELPLTDGTTYLLTVTVLDAAGNSASQTVSYVLDTTDPSVVVVPSAATGFDRTPSWTFTVVGATSASCVLRVGAVAVQSGSCSSLAGHTAAELPLTDGTTYLLTVTVLDAAGNSASQTVSYVLDTIAVLSSPVRPVSPSPDTTPTWTFTLEAGATATCALTGPGAPAGASDCSGGSYTPPALPATPGADYVLTVTVTDALTNITPYEQPRFRLDTVLPTIAITVPPGPSRSTTVTWSVAVDEILLSASCQLRRDGAVVLTLADCPGSTTVALPGDGQYDVVVTAVDLAGNASTTTSALLVHDATVPTAPVVSPGSTTTNRTTAVWTVTGEGGTAVTTCRVLRGTQVVQDTVPCSGTFSVDLPGDGEYVLEAVSTDPVGPGPVTRATYLLDTVLPTAPLVAGPTGPAQGRAPSWTVGTESGTTTECQLVRDGTVVNAWAPCSGGFGGALDGLPDGGYVLESRATDAAGNLGPVGRSAPYVLDTTAPLAPVVTGPTGPSQDRRPGFTWTGEAGSTATCTLVRDGEPAGGPVPCARTFTLTLDRDGTWTVTVQVTDAAGNVSPAAVSAGYVLDTTPPEAPIVTPPQTPGRDLAPSWGAVVEGGARLECRLTGADGVATEWTACALPLSTPLTGRPDGTYVLEVRATDAAGNLSPVGRGTYVLDTVAPAAAVVVGPAGGRSRTPVFSWTVEPGASTRCRLTSGATVLSETATCTSPAPLDLTGLPDGAYTLTVRVTDAAGNPGPAATGTYVLDTTGPAAPVLTLAPASPSPSRSPVYAFTSELGSTLVCRLAFPTGAVREISPCASPLTLDLTGLPDGSYTLTVRAVDAAGNLGAVLTEVHVLDSTVLAAPVLSGPTTPGSGRTPRWTLAPAPGAASTECRLTRGTTVLRDWIPCTTGYTADLFGQPDGTYVLSARSRDAAGAVSAAAQSRYVLDTTAPGGAVVTPPPTPSTNRLPTWTIASADAGASAECRLLVFGSVLRDWAPCAVTPAGSPYAVDLSGVLDGTYTLIVRLTDAAGNRSAVEVSSAYVLDTSAPVAVGVTPPPSPGNDRTPTWLLTSGAGVLLECRLSSAAGVVSDWAPCAGEYTADLAGLPDGTYVLAVRAVSAAGTPGPDTTRAYTLSTSAPLAPTALALSGGTTPTDNDRSPVWTFTLLDGTTATCRVVSGSTVLFDGPCTSPFRLDLSRAQDGSFTLTVRAVSAAGTPGAAATSTYVLDTVATSAPVFTSVPGATGSTLDPRWTFTVARGAKAQCRLLRDGVVVDDWTACSTPFTAQLSGRPDGAYELQVRAVDSAGNTSEPASSTYRLDRTALPLTSFTTTPAPTGSSGSLLWTVAPAAGTTAECRLVGPDSSSGWAPCAGAVPVDVTGRPDGTYALEARTIGADGARGAASSSTYQLDTRAPARPGFTVVPTPAVGSDPAPVWSWSTAADEMVECRLVRLGGGPVVDWRECTDGQYVADLTRFGQGGYALELRTTDAAGNTSPANSASYTWDARAPDAPTFLSRPATSGADRTVSWTFVVPGGTRATCTISRDRSVLRESACAGRYDLDLTGLPDGTYVLAVRLTDTAGNTGSPATSAYALRTSGLGGAGRVDVPPFRPEPAPVLDPPTGPGRIGTGAPSLPLPLAPAPPLVRRVVDGLDEQLVPRSPQDQAAGGGVDEPAPGAAEPEPRPTETNPLLPQALPAGDLPQVVRELVTGTATKPTLPLALLAIVVLFLLAQNRIDRRDPKLAAAPVEAEPELDFTAFIRRPGAAT